MMDGQTDAFPWSLSESGAHMLDWISSSPLYLILGANCASWTTFVWVLCLGLLCSSRNVENFAAVYSFYYHSVIVRVQVLRLIHKITLLTGTFVIAIPRMVPFTEECSFRRHLDFSVYLYSEIFNSRTCMSSLRDWLIGLLTYWCFCRYV